MGIQRAAQETRGAEVTFSEHEIIVSKTDTRGIITYANDVFLRVAGYTRAEIMGKPHNLIRHPDMPKAAFKLLWDRLKLGEEVFAYVINQTKNGDYYWVFAHVTPTFDENNKIIGYHSSRRSPGRAAINAVTPLYAALRDIERSHENPKKGMEQSFAKLHEILAGKKISYDEFVLSL